METSNRASDPDVRHYVYSTFARTSRPPTTLECAEHFDIPVADVEGAYERLAGVHHIALAPGSHSIWMAHPFSGLPTNYVTEIGTQRYWGNGVWDVLGIAAILGRDAVAHTPCGCGECRERLALPVRPGRPVDSDWIVHFMVPAVRFWENIGFTGATILAFRSKDHLDRWLKRRGAAEGHLMPIQTCWELAQKWYAGRLDRDWQRPGPAQIQHLFDRLGLKGAFWDLGVEE